MINTIKTVAGYLYSLADRILPFRLGSKSLQRIYNYLEYPSMGLVTSGQPTEHQLTLIADAGYRVVLNLAPHQAENALADEASIVESLGMRYCHIPVNFKKPSDDDFAQFVTLMQRFEANDLWIHCAANMRVSAFVYRYRCQQLADLPEQAKVDLHKIWQPFGVWKSFVQKTEIGSSKA